jgi:peptidoglycan hydrolase CwlO-like protein
LNDDKIIKDMQQKIKDLQLLFDSLNNEIKINDQKLKYMKHTILDNNL